MTTEEERIEIENREGLEYLSTIPENSIDLVLTEPIHRILFQEKQE